MITYDFNRELYQLHVGTIKDKPRFKHRGIMIDTARHYHPPIVLKHVLDSMSYVKLNVFHWHIVDEESFPYESKAVPGLWNGSYSQFERYSSNDITEIIEYANQRGIRVIPEFDTPAHMGSWCKGYPNICIAAKCTLPSPHLLDPSKEETWTVIKKLFTEASQRFHDSFFHLGSDEAKFSCYNNDVKVKAWMNQNNIKGAHGVYKYFTDRTNQIVVDLKRRPIVWEEVYGNFKKTVPKNTIIQIWLNHALLSQAAADGYDIIMSQGWYLDYLKVPWEHHYNNDMFKGIKNQNDRQRVIGGESCMWAEKVDFSVLDSTIWPKAAASAERLWSDASVTNVNQAKQRMRYFRCLLIQRGVAAAPVNNVNSREPPPKQDSCYKQ